MKIKSTKNTIVFIAMAIFLISGAKANAYVPGVWDPQPRVQTNETGFYVVPQPHDAPVVAQVTPTTVYNTNNNVNNNNSSSSTNSGITTTPKKVVSRVTAPSAKNTTVATRADIREIPPVVTIDQNSNPNSNGIAALSLAGSGGFMPSSVWQWLLVVLLILVIIILARTLSKPHGHDVVHH